MAVAILSRLITYPITKSQLKAAEKGKDFQKKYDVLKKKYKKNKEKLNEELMKLQSKYLPAQLGGCLPIIILIILLIQVRAGIRDLVDKGWSSFNEVAYVDSLERDVDSIKFGPEEELELGDHTLRVSVRSEDGNLLEKVYAFEVVEDEGARRQELMNEFNSAELKEEERAAKELEIRSERATDISLYSEFFAESAVNIPLNKFLIFVTESKSVYLTSDKNPDFEFYVRPPSDQIIVSNETKIYLDENDVTDKCLITQGEKINLDFLGIDLSKVAADFSWSDGAIIPYVILAVLVGGSQYATTQILTGIRGVGKDKKKEKSKAKKKAKKKQDEEMPDMTELMSMTSKQMMFMFPILTIVTSLGYWGGASIFPSGLSIFWTVQSLFVIIQQIMMNKEKVRKWLNLKLKNKNDKDK